MAFYWLHSNVAKASCILSTRRGTAGGASSPPQSSRKPELASYWTKVCPSNAAERSSSPRVHTMATGTEGRYLVVLVEVVGLVVPGLAVLMVA